jgi:hypothetical protein
MYTHLATRAVEQAVASDAARFVDELAGNLEHPVRADSPAKLRPGTAVTVAPRSPAIDFAPQTQVWDGEWVRYEFPFTPPAALAGMSLPVDIAILVDDIEIAHLACEVEVVENPLAVAHRAQQTARPYRKIFISYAREDDSVVRRCWAVQQALGDDVFLDAESIRAGEAWEAALANAIEEADVFQLFWSPAAARSRYVRYEWDFALRYRCEDRACVAFIRPVYWAEPLADPPRRLAHLNFRYAPGLAGI